MKLFRERNPLPLGFGVVAFLVVIVLVVANLNSVIDLFGRKYVADFSDAGGLQPGDPVLVGGLQVGRVTSLSLGNQMVDVDFSVTNGSVELGSLTTAVISTRTILGDKALTLKSAGPGQLPQGGTIPIARTTAPYDVSTALEDVGAKVTNIDTQSVAHALNVVSSTLGKSTPAFRTFIGGLSRLAETLGSRNDEITSLLGHANAFSGVLAAQGATMVNLVKDGNLILGEVVARRNDVERLIAGISTMSQQLSGLVSDNESTIGPALSNLNAVLTTLRANDRNLQGIITGLSKYATGLGEVVASGRFFSASVQNLAPGNLIPPTITLPKSLLGVIR